MDRDFVYFFKDENENKNYFLRFSYLYVTQ